MQESEDANLYLTDDDIPAFLNAGKRANKNRRKAYEDGKQVILKNQEELQKFVKDSIAGEIRGRTVGYGKVSSDLADKIYRASNGRVDVTGFFLELTADDLYHGYWEHETAKKENNLDITRDELIDALMNINKADVKKIEYHKDNRTDAVLTLPTQDGDMVMVEVVSSSTGGIKFKTGWKEKRNSLNSAGNNSSNPNSKLGSVRDSSASNNSISQPTKNTTKISEDFPIREDLVQQSSVLDDDIPIRDDVKTIETDEDWLKKKYRRIDKHLEVEKAELEEDYKQRKVEAQEELKDKNTYISKNAMQLYQELKHLKKGVKASDRLGFLLDHGYSWEDLKTALLNTRAKPDRKVNQNSVIESIVREMLNEEYENRVFEAGDMDNEYQKQVKKLEDDAAKERKAAQTARRRMTKQRELRAQMSALMGDTSTWQDKKMGVYYKVNTLRRNLRDIVRDKSGNRDIAKADAIYEEIQGKYNQHEAMLNREANKIKEFFRELKITKLNDTPFLPYRFSTTSCISVSSLHILSNYLSTFI